MKKPITYLMAVLMFSAAMPAFAQDNAPASNEQNQEAPPRELTEAEKAILMPGHMDNIDKPMTIRYEFSKTGTYEDGFEDTVTMDVKKVHDDDSVTVDLQFFTGSREVPFIQPHNEEHINLNSVIFIYLQGDVYEMTRLTGRKPQLNIYFNKRIRWALADNSTFTTEKVSVPFEGKQIEATKYTIQPYAKDPNRVDYDKFADKRYEFIISEQVPGELYQIRTVVPNNIEKNAPPLIEETLTLVSASPLKQTTANAD